MSFVNVITSIATGLKISPALLLAVCSAESDLRNVTNWNDGGSPSYGICQVKLTTARMFNKHITASQLLQPEINIKIAGNYLRYQLRRYKQNKRRAVAAYNSGTLRMSKGQIRNKAYVDKVMSRYKKFLREVKK